jgi:tRNA-dihydrouridine synthase
MSPFLPVQPAGRFRPKVWQDIAPEHNTALPLIPQLMGNQSDQFVDTLTVLHEQFGYERFNVNIGCPSSPVVRHTRGCGLMPHPEAVERIVAEVTSKTPFRLSLKMRLGLHSAEEGREVLRRLNDYPLDFLVIHPRLGDDLYEGTPHWDLFEEFCGMTRHKVVYSGDVFSKAEYQTLSERFPRVETWMLGRGMLLNPFLSEEIKNQEVGDKKSRFLAFYQDLAESLLPLRGENGTLANLKELWHYYASFAQVPPDDLQKMLRINNLQEFLTMSSNLVSLPFGNNGEN